MKALPTLYKKTSTGAIQYWSIFSGLDRWEGQELAVIVTSYGQKDTDSPQITTDPIWSGKNIGKNNETSALQQAEAETEARWTKQKKKGYVDSIEAAQAGEVDDLIKGGINPMLAHKFSDHSQKIVYPAFLQPKLDGIRILAVVKDGKCTLWSRTRKQITSLPHIIEQIESLGNPTPDMILDGEAYNHRFKNNFEHIVSLVRQEEPDPRHKDVQYHIYDICDSNKTFSDRNTIFRHMPKKEHLIKVETVQVLDEAETMQMFEKWCSDGYEGAMIRNANSLYEKKRSYNLQKIKVMQDDEFEIIDVYEGRGKMVGHAIFVCRANSGILFEAKMDGSLSKLAEIWQNKEEYKGKKLTVKYQGLTNKNKVPRFPIGVSIRDYE